MKRMIALLILVIFVFTSFGCLSPVSLDAYGYVITVGIERGEMKKYYFTFALQRELSEQNTEAEGGAIALAAEGDSIFEAVSEMEGNIPYSLNFSRTNFIVISREIAESGEIEDFVSTSFDALKIRTSAVIIVSEGEVSEFVGGMYANNEANISKLQSALMLDREKTGLFAVMSVSRLIEACSDGRFDYCTAFGRYDGEIVTDAEQKKSESEGKNPLEDTERGDRIGGIKSYIDGAAVFSGFRMAGVIDKEETMLLNMITGDFENGVISLEYKDGSSVSVLLSRRKRSVSVGDDLGVTADIALEASVQKKASFIPSEDMDAWLTEELPKLLSDRMMKLFYKLAGMNSDAMRFGSELVKRFSDTEEWERFDKKAWLGSLEPVFGVTVRNTDKYIAEDMQ